MAKDFYIQKGGYIQFDATTIEQYIKDSLNAGDSKFTDQNFEGSYFSSVIEVISYTFNVLMFYLNQTSSEGVFTDVQLYENMNRIVKMFGYNPVGYQTSILPYSLASTGLETSSVYNIPRYSYVNVGGVQYSFPSDVVFKSEEIDNITDEFLLYQGKFYEYPLYEAQGDTNEVVFLTPGNNVKIDHFNIDVYIQGKGSIWEKWERLDSLSTAGASDNVFEARFNESKDYELTFGDNVNGKALQLEDAVAIYYLQTDGDGNQVSVGDLSPEGTKYIRFASQQFTEIFTDITDVINIGTTASPENVQFSNTVPSSPFSEPETVDEIRTRAPLEVKSKGTLSKTADYSRAIQRLYSNVVSDVSTVDNWEYMNGYMKYFYELGENEPQNVSRILYNQVTFADACSFNNVYSFVRPKIQSGTEDYNSFLSPALKQSIVSSLQDQKLLNSEMIIADPVYMAVDVGINDLTTTLTPDDVDLSQLVIVKSKTSVRTDDVIISEVNEVFQDYFSQDETELGMTISFSDLNSGILGVDGVVSIKTTRTDSDLSYNGLSIVSWNPVYEQDIEALLRNKTYEYFQVPYLNNKDEFIDKIIVEVEE